MKHLDIPNVPDELFERIERRAQEAGRSLPEQATELLVRGLSADEAEHALLEAIRKDREALAKKGVWMTQSDLDDALRLFRRGLDLVRLSDRPSDAVGVFNLCQRSGCSGYDAEFIWLAIELNLRVVTADSALIKAFPDIALGIEDFASGK